MCPIAKRWARSIVKIIVVCLTLQSHSIDSAPASYGWPRQLVRRMLNEVKIVKTAEDLGPLRPLSDNTITDYQADGDVLGKITTFDNHVNNIFKDRPLEAVNFRDWVGEHGPIVEDGKYAETHFHDHLMAWLQEKKATAMRPAEIARVYRDYPLSDEFKLEISLKSYLYSYDVTLDEFIARFLPFDLNFQNDFRKFIADYTPAKKYMAAELFKKYEEYAMTSVSKLTGENQKMLREPFMNSYLPISPGLRRNYEEYLDARGYPSDQVIPVKQLMLHYFEWSKGFDVRRLGVVSMNNKAPDGRLFQIIRGENENYWAYAQYYSSDAVYIGPWLETDVQRLFRTGLGDSKHNIAFTRRLYKDAFKEYGKTPEEVYLRGDVHWRYVNWAQKRRNANFIKRIRYKLEYWKDAFMSGFKSMSFFEKIEFFFGLGWLGFGTHFVF